MANAIESIILTLQENWPQYVKVVVTILFILIGAKLLIGAAEKVLASVVLRQQKHKDGAAKRRLDTASTVLRSVIKYGIWVLAGISILGQLGLGAAVNSILAAAGVGGLALGIGAQSFIKDIVAGSFFLFENQMSVGDYVTVADISGTVEEITLRATIIRSFRGERHIIPNGAIGVITNFSRADYLAQMDISIAYEADTEKAMRCMRKEAEAYAKENAHVLHEPELLGVIAMGDSFVTLRMMLRVEPMTHFMTERALNLRIKQRFEKEGIQVPHPQLVVLRQDERQG